MDAREPAEAGEGRDATELLGVSTHNLKAVDVRIPLGALTVVSGVSGSGKSSLAFDTLYAEGQRRYVESLSTYARQFLSRMERPPCDAVHNIQPAVALRQKNVIRNARSTVSSLTEIGDHLHLIYSHVGVTRCPDCGLVVKRDSPHSIAAVMTSRPGHRFLLVADVEVLEHETTGRVLQGLVAEGYRRIYDGHGTVTVGDVEAESLLESKRLAVVADRLRATEGSELRIRDSVEQALRLGRGRLRVIDVTEADSPEQLTFDTAFRCNGCGEAFIEPIPQLFSTSSPIGACEVCSGFGRTAGVDFDKVVPNHSRSLEEGAVVVFESKSGKPSKGNRRRKARMLKAAMARGIAIDVPFRALSAADRDYILEGGKGYSGLRGFFQRLEKKRYRPHYRMILARFRGYTRCEACGGRGLSRAARNVTVGGRAIDDFAAMTVSEAFDALGTLELGDSEHAKVRVLFEEVESRLRFLMRVGLGYLGLDRQSRTLSGGEVQRIHLTSSVGRMLTDTLYVLDEPTAGLHARDTERLLSVLHSLRDLGNSVVVVEHDPEIIAGADWVVEIGPQGGARGGEILYQGDLDGLARAATPTGLALTSRHAVAALHEPSEPFVAERAPHFSVVGARANNLRDVTVHFPVGKFVCVTGVSGSGKSTLVEQVLHRGYRRARGDADVEPGECDELVGLDVFSSILMMKQGGMARSSRSNVASYTKAWDPIRKLFGGTMDSKRMGLGPGSFSFNTAGGRCERCQGTGRIVVEMHFMADIEVVCEVCEGRRFTDKVLSVKVSGASIYDVLEMTVDEALTFFAARRAICSRLAPLVEVGLGYLRLGQTTSTLSGGEAQRLMLASYVGKGLGRKKHDSVLFIFDEPTIGLHLQDVAVLVAAIRKVVDQGHTAVVVEHNTDFIAQADHIIDLGPEGGDGGGEIVVTGSPAEVAACPRSWTGRYLAEITGGPLS